MQARLQLEVEVQVGLGERRLDTCLVQERAQALVLLSRKNDRRPIASRRETGQRPRLADERLSLEPPEIDRVAGSLRARKQQVGPCAEVVGAIDRRKFELTRQLTPAGLRRSQHGRLVKQRSGVGSLARRLKVDDNRVFRHMVEE